MADLKLKIIVDGAGAKAQVDKFVNGSSQSLNKLSTSFKNGPSRAIKQMRDDIGHVSTGLKLMTAGGVAAFTALAKKSVEYDRTMMRIKQTGGMTKSQIESLRTETKHYSSDLGLSRDSMASTVNQLVQMGLKYDVVKASLGDIAKASVVTGADSLVLAKALGVAAASYDIDLSKQGAAAEILDQMTTAARLGNAELESLSDIWARVGVNAKSAGMSMPRALALTETLSQIEMSPERLATLTDSFLRLYNNNKYYSDAAEAGNVRAYNKDGSKRDPIEFLKALRERGLSLKTDQQRDDFNANVFGKADLDTQKALKQLLFSGTRLSKDGSALNGNALDIAVDFEAQISKATGTIKKDMPEATAMLAVQIDRLKQRISNFVDDVMHGDGDQKSLSNKLGSGLQGLLDNPDGLKTAAGGIGVVGLLSAWSQIRSGRGAAGAIGGVVGKGMGAAGAIGVAAGAVTPVFVTNWPAGGIGGGLSDAAGVAAGAGASGLLSKLSPMLRLIAGAGGAGIAAGAGVGMITQGVMYQKQKREALAQGKAAPQAAWYNRSVGDMFGKKGHGASESWDDKGATKSAATAAAQTAKSVIDATANSISSKQIAAIDSGLSAVIKNSEIKNESTVRIVVTGNVPTAVAGISSSSPKQKVSVSTGLSKAGGGHGASGSW